MTQPAETPAAAASEAEVLQPEELSVGLFGSSHMMLTLRGEMVRARVDEFRGACKAAGAVPDRSARSVMVPLPRVGDLLARLVQLGFEARVRPDAQLALDFEAEHRAARAKVEAARAAEAAGALERRLAPHRDKLFPFQVTGAEWLAPRDRALLCDEPGMGKTRVFLLAVDGGERGASPPGVLVVCPANAKGVWANETALIRPDLRVSAIKGEGNFRWPVPGELLIINYDILPKPVDIDTSPMGKCYLIGDEIHYLKIAKSQRTAKFRAIREKVTNCGGVTWGGTGTPLCDRAQDLWAIAQAFGLSRDAFGSHDEFVDLYGGTRVPCPKCQIPCRACGGTGKDEKLEDCEKCGGRMRFTARKKCGSCHGEGKAEDGSKCGKCGGSGRAACKVCRGRETILGELLTPSPEVRDRFARIALRRTKAEHLPDLPEIRYQAHSVELEEEVSEDITESLPEGWEESLEEALDSADGGTAFEEYSHARAVLAEAKGPAALDFARSYAEQGEPLVVFSAHKAPLGPIARLPNWALIDGSTSADRRTEIARAFQAGELAGIAANIKAGGTSITLTRATNLLFVDKSFTPAENWQARDRIHRIGQTRGVLIHSLICDHALDQRVEEILEKKRKLIEGSLGT